MALRVRSDPEVAGSAPADGPTRPPRQTQHDFELDRQTRVHKGKLRIDEEFVRKEKDLEVKKRMCVWAHPRRCRGSPSRRRPS